MANTYSLALALGFKLRENLDAATMPEATDKNLEYGPNFNVTLNSGSVPAITKAAVLKQTCNGSDQTIDLTAMGHTLGRTVDNTGLAPVALLIEADGDNAGGITLKAGASNGFPILGAASLVVLRPGNFIVSAGQGTQAVDSTHKNVTVNGTSGDVLTITAVFGAIPS